jgi:YidC/Oxa1 family membrane protein insertase
MIMMVWLFMMSPTEVPTDPGTSTSDSTEAVFDSEITSQSDSVVSAPAPIPPPDGGIFASVRTGDEKLTTVENNVYRAVFSSHGGTLVSLELKNYNQSDRVTPVQMVDTTKTGAIGLVFTSIENRLVDTRALYFEPSVSAENLDASSAGQSLEYKAEVESGSIVVRYTFAPDTYEITVDVNLLDSENFAARQGYEIVWDGGIPFAEDNRKTEAMRTGAYARTGGDVVGVDLRKDS